MDRIMRASCPSCALTPEVPTNMIGTVPAVADNYLGRRPRRAEAGTKHNGAAGSKGTGTESATASQTRRVWFRPGHEDERQRSVRAPALAPSRPASPRCYRDPKFGTGDSCVGARGVASGDVAIDEPLTDRRPGSRVGRTERVGGAVPDRIEALDRAPACP